MTVSFVRIHVLSNIMSSCEKLIVETVDSLCLDLPLPRISLYLKQNVWSLEIFSQEYCIAFLYFELLHLELFPISNTFSGSLNHFLSISRTLTYSNFIFEFPNKFEFESKQKFRPYMKKNLFILSVAKTKMPVKRKLSTKTLKEKCDTLSHIEKGMKNKEAANKFGVPKNTISTSMKNKEKFFQGLEESAPSTKQLRGCQCEKVNKVLFEWFILQRSQNIPIDGSMIQEKGLFLPRNWRSLTLKDRMGGLISRKKVKITSFTV